MPDFIKQNVQWFPGHMAKTRRLIKESLNLVDGVVEIVDARIPVSSRNPELDSIIKKKPRIILLNKCDVADSKVKQALKSVIERNDAKGMSGKPLRLMVVGIPNTGKSSFINRMGKNAKAKVADKAGVTRQNQWFVVGNGIELLDTPGVLWPKFDDPEVGDKLAFIGSVKDEVTDKETLACRLLESLAATRPQAIEDRYKISGISGLQGWEILEMIGKKRGFLIKGGEIDYERAAVIVADEFRGGKLGRITLELPIDE